MAQKTQGVIAAGHPKTAEAGRLILEAGGNAFDAAIAAVLAACVVESTLTSLGGGGFLLAHSQNRKNQLFDFFCQTPQHKKAVSELDFGPVDLNFGGAVQTFHIGKASIAVPGLVAGLFTVHQKLGRLPFKVLIEPAVDYARRGFTLNVFNAFTYRLLQPILTHTAEGQAIYSPQGALLEAGETGRCPDLANTLEYLAQKGAPEFYQGDLAQHLVASLANGGYLTLEDLQSYQVLVRPPLALTYRGHRLLTNPPPSSGGSLIAFALKLLEAVDMRAIALESVEHLALFSQIMALTNQARNHHYDPAIYQSDIAARFLSEKLLQQYQASLVGPFPSNKLGSTTHISVLDQEGNAASVTSSNGEGSAHFLPGTGIMLNNMLGEADLNPHGFHQWATGQRLSSMMAPTLLLGEQGPELVLGSGGSNRIRTALWQVISHYLDFGLALPEAVTQSRLHWEDYHLNVEPFKNSEVLENLAFQDGTQVHRWQEQNMFFGGVHAVGYPASGILTGVGDPRRAGAVEYSYSSG
jgi:gamma-glutamyltranspeptidase/glutathione hydrolase